MRGRVCSSPASAIRRGGGQFVQRSGISAERIKAREREEEDGIGAGAEATAVPVVPSVVR